MMMIIIIVTIDKLDDKDSFLRLIRSRSKTKYHNFRCYDLNHRNHDRHNDDHNQRNDDDDNNDDNHNDDHNQHT